jgi:hypothetical protein
LPPATESWQIGQIELAAIILNGTHLLSLGPCQALEHVRRIR